MPSCKAFFEDLGNCLKESDCMKLHGLGAKDCLEKLLTAKTYDRITFTAKTRNVSIDESKLPIVDPRSPRECGLKHQAYVECKISLVMCISILLTQFR